MPKSLKKTIIYSNEETKDIIEKTMEELNEQYGVKMSKIVESMILCNIAPEHPRTSIWKAIKSLQSEGFEIETRPGVGYRLMKKNDVLSLSYIREHADTDCRIIVLDQVDSTNNYAKGVEDISRPVIVISNSQTKGRGRMGRSFYSPHSKGLYLSIVFEPDFGLEKSMLITTVAALTVCRALEDVTGLGPKIKWVNDIYLNDKKVCGILTEAETNFETGSISRIIVGIGINCFEQTFPEELLSKATYISGAPLEFSRNQLAAAIINHFFNAVAKFDKRTLLREYRSRSMILGKQILIYGPSYSSMPENGGTGIRARAIDIDDNGGLVVEYLEGRHAREMDTLTGGEITIRKDLT